MNIEKAKEVLQQMREDAVKTAQRIKNPLSQEAYLRKANYQLQMFEQTIKEAEKQPEAIEIIEYIEATQEPTEIEDRPVKTVETMSIRNIIGTKGKECARQESINRAKALWPELY